MKRVYGFDERYEYSNRSSVDRCVVNYLINTIPNCIGIKRADKHNDRRGIDYWLLRNGVRPIAVDMKHYSYDPIDRYGVDTICIETTSVYTGPHTPPWLDEYRIKPGWTIDASKETDLVVYTFPQANGTRRFWMAYFPILCLVANKYWRYWARQYGEYAAMNVGYMTLSVHPPREVVVSAMQEYYSNSCCHE
jgi:hypothetical protein